MTINRNLIETLLSKGHTHKCCYCSKKLSRNAKFPDHKLMTLEHLCPTTCHQGKPDNRLANLSIACRVCNNHKESNCLKDCKSNHLNQVIGIKIGKKMYKVTRKTLLNLNHSDYYDYSVDNLLYF